MDPVSPPARDAVLATTTPHHGAAWRRPMRPRSPSEPHRAATPLELLFDLVFVVAIAQAAAGLHHAVAGNHAAEGVIQFAMSFFAIWWAWMNFTWFASAYDSDDVPYRLAVFLQMTGALIMAAGVPQITEGSLALVTAGYVVMRLAGVAQWLRAAANDPAHRTTARRYAVGIAVVQAGWLLLLAVPPDLVRPGFVFLAGAELAVPVWAERVAMTPWHPHHMAERYGLFTIIVLGESILAATTAVQAALAGGTVLVDLLPVITGGLLIVYALWWLYFYRPVHDLLTSFPRAIVWGYGHYLVFGSAAAVGAGLTVAVDLATGHGAVSRVAAGAAVAIPTAIYLVSLALLHFRAGHEGGRWLAPVSAILVLLTPWTREPVLAIAVILVILLAIKLAIRHRVTGRSGSAPA